MLRQLDLFGTLEGPGAWASLVAAATRLAAEAKIDVVRFRADAGDQARRLDELGLQPRPSAGTIYYRLLEYAEPEHEPLFTDLDGDRCVELLL